MDTEKEIYMIMAGYRRTQLWLLLAVTVMLIGLIGVAWTPAK